MIVACPKVPPRPTRYLAGMIRPIVPILLAIGTLQAAPHCDDPSVRKALVASWDRMAKTKSEQLADSRVKVWNLRQDGKPGECRADFLARKPGSSVGGSLPYRVKPLSKGRISVQPNGEPTLNLLQSDSGSPGEAAASKVR